MDDVQVLTDGSGESGNVRRLDGRTVVADRLFLS